MVHTGASFTSSATRSTGTSGLKGADAICEDQPSCSAERPTSAHNLPSSIHPDYFLQTGDDFLLVTDDDVGFYVDRDFRLCHSECFHDFEKMVSDIGNKDAVGDCINISVVRRDMSGELSKGYTTEGFRYHQPREKIAPRRLLFITQRR
ncbi:hypothetical protein L198_06669 [Cryptococcus wingfieldii CBS 7118]|uniref:Uncharacterized protein n=1 Tax=Cryptococcus wingfieldii CBS 7118 TaxID=1295528 RepID=A0A1E3IIP1_9TREE|nr:hypothetical protein L198_06669 [Cryptococcus wingfieldii CBS 7118]ODN88398.1 hypothetical protein L198_06669 [Cryptococcus wingfieldii CBS 7118]